MTPEKATELPVYLLDPKSLSFPDPTLAGPNGLLAVGGDLSPDRLISAYRRGIFPWFSEGEPIMWFSPDPRMVLAPRDVHVGRSLRRRLRSARYQVSHDEEFNAVVDACAAIPRADQDGTWITTGMQEAYAALHRLGHSHSIEVWEDDVLVGGLYGMLVGTCFCGESMFSIATDASKVAFVSLAETCERAGVTMIDCQMPTDHLARLGAAPIPRAEFLTRLREAVSRDVGDRWAKP